MFSTISWQQYFCFILIANGLYYGFVWIVVYKAKLPLFSGFGNVRSLSLHGEDQPDEILTTAQHIMDEIRPQFNGRSNKNELMLALQGKLKRYADWDEPGFRETLNEFIAGESLSKCSIRLSVEDQRVLWL
jgi:hypothetical protein